MASHSTCHERAYIFHLARFTLKEAFRNRLFFLLIGLAGLLTLLSLFIGDLTITESTETKLIILSSIIRICSVLIVSLFVATSMLREQNDRQVQMIFSLPMKRSSYYWGKWLGFALLSMIAASIMSIPILLLSFNATSLIWLLTLYMELMIIASMSLLMLISFNQLVASMLGVIAFYTLSRSLNGFQMIAENPIQKFEGYFQDLALMTIKAINTLFPNLDQFAQSEWLAYQTINLSDLSALMVQTLIYTSLLACASLFDLYRKGI